MRPSNLCSMDGLAVVVVVGRSLLCEVVYHIFPFFPNAVGCDVVMDDISWGDEDGSM